MLQILDRVNHFFDFPDVVNDHSVMVQTAGAHTSVSRDGTAVARSNARTERIRRRHAQILEAAAHLMQKSGYHGVSMQSVADEAHISVGLIYQYFGNKEDLLRAVIVDILSDFHEQVPASMERAGTEPVERLMSGFRTFCQIIAEKPEATVLAYRESKTLNRAGRDQMKQLEVETALPLRRAVTDGVETGIFAADTNADLVVHNLVLAAHGWALKHWSLAPKFSLDDYVEQQFRLLMRAIRVPR